MGMIIVCDRCGEKVQQGKEYKVTIARTLSSVYVVNERIADLCETCRDWLETELDSKELYPKVGS